MSTVIINPVQGTAGSQVTTAIGVSVACTFFVCFLIAAVVIFLLIKFWRRKHFEQQSAQSSSTQLTELSRGDTPFKRNRTETATTVLSEDTLYDNNGSVPTIQIEDAEFTGSNHSLRSNKHTILPAIKWAPPRSITPVLLPERLKSGFGKKHSLSSRNLMDSPRKAPEGSDHELAKTERSPSVNSWFPAQEVQYNV